MPYVLISTQIRMLRQRRFARAAQIQLRSCAQDTDRLRSCASDVTISGSKLHLRRLGHAPQFTRGDKKFFKISITLRLNSRPPLSFYVFGNGECVSPSALRTTYTRLFVTQETGPTIVGDEFSDLVLMAQLEADKRTVLGNNFSEYYVNEPPRVTLNKLERLGYRVVSMTGVGQTLVWCLHKE
ncbi:hypothetical protein XELAEV_18040070mg [Xenopus laevis]|uniref:GTP cyclohydrolase 1 feedback regulatory protein n=1 Tax=Xenopus laevis TaxID=8355 RepID=A0A974H8K9_XENLA|nr:hypothetical protein XELAEV_18040070mg [Xenopus laevis]